MMHRKQFLQSFGLLSAYGALAKKSMAAAQPNFFKTPYRIPPCLKPGDVIGITAPAGFIMHEDLQPAMAILKSWGFQIQLGKTIGTRNFTFSADDAARCADLQQMLDDPNIKAILCARGGYGAVRFVDAIHWAKFIKHPKWVIGFSDVSVLHQHIHTNCCVATIHSKMTNSFPKDWNLAEPAQVESIRSIYDALSGKKMQYHAPFNNHNRLGKAAGFLIGGNLKTLESLAGTASDIKTDGKILFVEDTGEYLYSIDRMFWNLKRTGKLSQLAGLIVGGFNIKPDDEGEAFGLTLSDIVLEKIRSYHYPVVFDFPVGHQRANFALKCGVMHRLEATPAHTILTEIL